VTHGELVVVAQVRIRRVDTLEHEEQPIDLAGLRKHVGLVLGLGEELVGRRIGNDLLCAPLMMRSLFASGPSRRTT
jgi:hypothetical protein